MKNENNIKYKDLSTGLKLCVIWVYLAMIWTAFGILSLINVLIVN